MTATKKRKARGPVKTRPLHRLIRDIECDYEILRKAFGEADEEARKAASADLAILLRLRQEFLARNSPEPIRHSRT
jgi:hypothetical protein